MSSKQWCFAAAWVAGLLLEPILRADDQVDYLKHVKPLLAERCYACHGALKQEGNLRLDTAASAIHGGDSGPAIIPGDAAESLLIQKVSASDESERMPPEGEPLKPEQIAVLRTWISQHAKSPADEQPESNPKDHWAFRPIVKPSVPSVANSAWVRNPIDAFIAQQHEQIGLTPQVEAPRALLVRRLFLDLIGLPPSADDLAALKGELDPNWYESLAHKLLADPRHGERWARHWMDIWRYSDWWGLGGQVRNSHRHMWHWRDWIVESLNSNLPYDEMIRQMLAADELYPDDAGKLRATGFLARNWSIYGRNLWMEETVEHVGKGFLGLTLNCAKCHDHKYDPLAQEDFYRMRAFFEPYHVRIDMLPTETDITRDGITRVFDGWLDKPTYRFERGQESQPDTSKVIAPGVPEIFAFDKLNIRPIKLPKESWQPARRAGVLEAYLKPAQASIATADAAKQAAREKVETAKKQLPNAQGKLTKAEKAAFQAAEAALSDAQAELYVAELALDIARAEAQSIEARTAAQRAAWAKEDDSTMDPDLAAAERDTAREAIVAERRVAVAKSLHAVASIELRRRQSRPKRKGALEKELATALEGLTKAEEIAGAALTEDDHFTPLAGAVWTPTRQIFATTDDPPVPFPPESTGRRTALAKWITDRRNPLTARVAVNHLWTRHMGTPLVATTFNFGRKGALPTNPDLLNWLAAELIDSGWDMKHLHRLIVESATYRMSSSTAGKAEDFAKDSENRYQWRRSPAPLESQIVRDSILSLAGTLDLTRGGPSVDPGEQLASMRRSLYFYHSNNDRNLFLMSFDEASVNECYRRDQSIIPQQALALSNSGLVLDAAQKIAKRLSKQNEIGLDPIDDVEFIQRAYFEMLGIRASEAELRTSAAALDAWRKLPDVAADKSSDRAREYFIWALFNHHDFVAIR